MEEKTEMQETRGRFVPEGGRGEGPGGFCVCPKCGYSETHRTGVPCFKLKCPYCNVPLARK